MKSIFLFIVTISFLIFNDNAYTQIFEQHASWIKVADGLNFPEGPAFDGKSSIYISNCYGGWITKYSYGKIDTFSKKNDDLYSIEKTNGLSFSNDALYACEYGKGKILKIHSNGIIEEYVSDYNGKRFNRPNDMIFDKTGNLIFTDPNNYDKNILDGRIFLVDPKSKEVFLIADSLAFPNGINISPVDGRLYVCESAFNRILSYDITKQNKLTNKKIFAVIPGGDPDGIEFDIEGNLYVAHFGGKAVYVFSPEGKLITKVETPGSKPTNIEFGDSDYKTLYLTEVETNSMYKIRTIIPGKNMLEKNN